MLRTYPLRISRKRVLNSEALRIKDEEDGSWNKDSPTKRMHGLVPTLCNAFCRNAVIRCTMHMSIFTCVRM